jgi:hypothetical protein
MEGRISNQSVFIGARSDLMALLSNNKMLKIVISLS